MAMATKRDAPMDTGTALVASSKKAKTDLTVVSQPNQTKNAIKRTSTLQAPIIRLEGHKGELFTCKYSPDGDVFASAGHDRDIFLWRKFDSDCENFAVMQGHKNAVLELHWSSDGERMVSASPDKTVRAWDVVQGVQVKKMGEHADVVNSCHLLPKGAPLLVSGSEDACIKLWDLRAKRSVQTLEDQFQILSVCIADAGDQVFSSSIDNTVKVWDLRKEAELMSLVGHGDSVTGMALHDNSQYLLTNSMDNTLRVWDVRPFAPGNRCMHVLQGHQHTFEKHLLKCAWSADGKRVSAGSGDRMVYVWDMNTHTLEYKLPGHTGSVNEVAFHPKEPVIASASSDSTIYMGELSPTEEL